MAKPIQVDKETFKPDPRIIRSTIRAAEQCIANAGHSACGLTRLQFDLMLEQISRLYEFASWLDDGRPEPHRQLTLSERDTPQP